MREKIQAVAFLILLLFIEISALDATFYWLREYLLKGGLLGYVAALFATIAIAFSYVFLRILEGIFERK